MSAPFKTVPSYLDCFVVGVVLNIIALAIGSALTQVTPEEERQRKLLFIMPEEEKNPKEVQITKRILAGGIGLGVFVTAILLCFWVVPYLKAV